MLNYQERLNLKYGDKVFMFYPGFGRNSAGRYTRPLEVTRVTPTQFTIEGEHKDSKPKRFMKETGHEVGSGRGYHRHAASISLVTDGATKAVDKFNAEELAKDSAKDAEARAIEVSLREKYSVITIIDEEIQGKYLAPLRELAENGETEMQKFLDNFEDVTVADGNFYRVNDAVRRETENGYFSYGQKVRDYAISSHAALADAIVEFSHGTRFEFDKKEVMTLAALMRGMVKQMLNRQLDRFFGSYHSEDITSADQAYIRALRDILGETYSYDERIRKIKDDEEAE